MFQGFSVCFDVLGLQCVWCEPKYIIHKLLKTTLWLTKWFINVLYNTKQLMFGVLLLALHILLYNLQKVLFVI